MLYSKYENVYHNQYTVFIICWHLVCMNPLINVDFIHVLFMVSLDKKTFWTFFFQRNNMFLTVCLQWPICILWMRHMHSITMIEDWLCEDWIIKGTTFLVHWAIVVNLKHTGDIINYQYIPRLLNVFKMASDLFGIPIRWCQCLLHHKIGNPLTPEDKYLRCGGLKLPL